jgi:hypothetical protein
MLADAGYRVTSLSRLAVLEDHMLLAIRRFPQLSVGLHMRMADQHERLAAQLVICQLPRVEDRVLAMMWLLAESWGRVTSSGTALPISLTHDALGELIGAKRPTVTLALRELSERGALVRTDQGWLLLEPLDEAEAIPSFGRHPAVIGRKLSPWAPESAPEPASEPGDTLQQTLRMLQADHQRNAASYQARVELSDATRERSRELRESIRRDRLS